MKVGIMQPYILPYIGYFQLLEAVDVFVVYDNIQYTKKGWINRNRMLLNGKDEYFTIPLKKDSDLLDVKERRISDDFNYPKLLNKFYITYHKAPYFEPTYLLLEKILKYETKNLFEYIYYSIELIIEYLNIKTKIIVSSSIEIDHSLRSKDKVIAICKELQAQEYINPIGGLELYTKEYFYKNDINLQFIQPKLNYYQQFQNEFIPGLSIIDLLMFNDKKQVKLMLQEYDLK